MFSEEMRSILLGVITSWEVLGVTVALILFFSFVGHVASSYRRPRRMPKLKRRRTRKAAATIASSAPEEASDSSDTNEALGLREAD